MIQNTPNEIINVPLAHWVRRSYSTKVRRFNEIVIEHEKNVFFIFFIVEKFDQDFQQTD